MVKCVDCGNDLTPDEITYLDNVCNMCETLNMASLDYEDDGNLIKSPPIRHVVKGWWLYREFDTEIEAENFLREWKIKIIQSFSVAILLGFLLVVVCALINLRGA